MRRWVLVLTAAAALAGCARETQDAEPGTATSASPSSSPAAPVGIDPDLRDELLAMERRDQRQRTGGVVEETDEERTARLQELIEVHGWPTYDLVGRRAADSAWVIAQHSDLDPLFQAEALALIRDAAARGQASPGNVAYLEDRVAVARRQPQTYGTQVTCTPAGPEPATPIGDEQGVDDRRAAAGLPPLADYLREMTAVCAGEGP